jgi:hypothetical protein
MNSMTLCTGVVLAFKLMLHILVKHSRVFRYLCSVQSRDSSLDEKGVQRSLEIRSPSLYGLGMFGQQPRLDCDDRII